MEKILNKKLTKKGFTLAELLIVVAIIAVLIAIAAPLFIGALDDAKTAVKNANIRAVKGAAVAEILMDNVRTTTDKKNYGTEGPWYATAQVAANGDVTNLQVQKITGSQTDKKEDCVESSSGSGYDVSVIVKELTVS